MPLISCPNCSANISTSAEACPRCGITNLSQNRKPKEFKKSESTISILSVLSGIIGLCCAIGLLYSNSNHIFGTPHEVRLIEDTQEKPHIKYNTKISNTARDMTKSVDVNHATTRAFSLKIAQEYPGEFNINQVANIYRKIREDWKYVNDPSSGDYFSKASETINNNLAGDCDDFAILMSALVSGIGGTTRITSASIHNKGHAYTEVKIANSIEEFRKEIEKIDIQEFLESASINQDSIYYRKDDDGALWLNLDWTSTHIGGKYYEHRSITTLYPLLGYYFTNDPSGKKRNEQ